MLSNSASEKPQGKHRLGLLLAGLVLILAATIGLTWLVAWKVQSPAQREASAKAPPAMPITVAIQRGELRESTYVNATVEGAASSEIKLPLPGDVSVISAQGVRAGETLAPGSVVTWINGRPTIALTGSFPLWRDITEGDSGADVVELQNALNELGYGIAADGVFGPGTASAVKSLYKAVGSWAQTDDQQVEQAEHQTSEQDKDDSEAQPPSTKKVLVVPKSEILMFASLPVTVTSVPATGTSLNEDNAKLVLGTGGVTVKGSVGGAVANTLKAGMNARATVGGKDIALVIDSVQEAKPTNKEEQSNLSVVTFSVKDDASALKDLVGTGEQVSVEVALSDPIKNALLVPERAIVADGKGQLNVLVKNADGEFEIHQVEQLRCTNGTCAISSKDGEVAEGAQVRVDR